MHPIVGGYVFGYENEGAAEEEEGLFGVPHGRIEYGCK